MFWALTWLSAVSVAAEPAAIESSAHVAVVSATGSIFASPDGGATWESVHRCPLPVLQTEAGSSEPDDVCASPAAIAWLRGSLYMACTGGELWRWQPGTGTARPAGGAAVDQIVALGRRDRDILAVDRDGAIWAYEPGDPAVRVTTAPEPARAVAGRGEAIAVAGATAVWQRDRTGSGWTPVAPVRACALATAPGSGDAPGAPLWIAGPDGLFVLHSAALRTQLLAPVTGVAVANATVVLVKDLMLATLGDHVHRRSSGPRPRALTGRGGVGGVLASDPDGSSMASPAPHIHWSDLLQRARWARWVPTLSAGLSYRSSDQTRATVGLWVWLTWTPTTEVFQ